jgi:hypothetical protein
VVTLFPARDWAIDLTAPSIKIFTSSDVEELADAKAGRDLTDQEAAELARLEALRHHPTRAPLQ